MITTGTSFFFAKVNLLQAVSLVARCLHTGENPGGIFLGRRSFSALRAELTHNCSPFPKANLPSDDAVD